VVREGTNQGKMMVKTNTNDIISRAYGTFITLNTLEYQSIAPMGQ
jgi:hypothetical protein